MDRVSLLAQARDALGRLYQPPLLQIHSLAELLLPESPAGERGSALKEILLDTIQQLRPPYTSSHESPAWRRYRSLCQLYLEGKSFDRIAQEQGVSERQARRDVHQALEELGDFLWARYCQVQAPSSPRLVGGRTSDPSEEEVAGEAEVARIGSLPPGEPLRIEVALRDALTLAGKLADQLGTRVMLVVPEHLPAVAVNQTVLRQALLSILGWVLEACPGGQVVVRAAEVTGQVEVNIRASDWQARAAAADEGPARLRLGRRLLVLQGGSVTVMAGKGSCQVAVLVPSAERAVVLVVDDNPDVSLLFQRYIQTPALHLVRATTVDEALALLHEIRPRLITLDLMMPQRDGWDLLQLLTQDPATRDIPIAVCSVVHERALALAVGATYFLPKPVSRDALLAVLGQCGLALDRLEIGPQAAHQLAD